MFSSNIPLQAPGELPVKPTIGHTVYDSGAEALQTLGLAASAIPGVASPETRANLSESLSAIDETMKYPYLGLGQRALDGISSFATYGVATLPLAFGADLAATGIVGRAALSMSPALPDALVNFARTPITKLAKSGLADYLPKATVGEGANATLGAYAAYKAAVFPQHLADTFDAQTDRFNLRNAASETLNDNYGFLLAAAPIVSGFVLFKAFKTRASGIEGAAVGKVLADDVKAQRTSRQSTLEQALDKAKASRDSIEQTEKNNLKALNEEVAKGNISESYRDFYKDYIKDPDSPEVHAQAMKIARDEGLPIDQASGKHWLKLIEPQDVNNLKQAYADRVTSGLEEGQDDLHQFMINNILDRNREKLTDNQGLKEGLNAYTEYVDKKLAYKDEKLASLDRVIDKSLHRGLRKNEMLSQKSIYNHLKTKGEFDSARIPYTVPKRVAYKLKLRKELNEAKVNKADPEVIKELKDRLNGVKLLSPADELKSLREKLLHPKRIEENVSHHPDFHRLEDLAELHPNAEMLVKRLHEEKEYLKQGAYSTFMKSFLNFVDSSVGSLADPNNVTRYLKNRIEREKPESFDKAPTDVLAKTSREDSKAREKLLKQKDVSRELLNVEMEKLLKTKAKDAKSDLTYEKNRLEQFDENEQALQQLIDCAEDFMNG